MYRHVDESRVDRRDRTGRSNAGGNGFSVIKIVRQDQKTFMYSLWNANVLFYLHVLFTNRTSVRKHFSFLRVNGYRYIYII